MMRWTEGEDEDVNDRVLQHGHRDVNHASSHTRRRCLPVRRLRSHPVRRRSRRRVYRREREIGVRRESEREGGTHKKGKPKGA